MKPPLLYITLILILAQGCTKNSESGNEKNFQDKSYIHLFYETEKECLDSQPPDFFINCHQQIDFHKNDLVEIMLSDIIWRGKYSVENDSLIMTFEPNFEIPEGVIVFEIVNDSLLKNLSNGTLWKEMKGNSIWN